MDLFISYSSRDRPFVEQLARDLDHSGLKVWWDQWQLDVGDSLAEKIQEGILTSAWLGVVLSPDSVESPWVKRELSAALAEEITDRKLFVLPLLLRDCVVPLFLRDKVYADCRHSYENGLNKLLARLQPPVDRGLLRGLLCLDESRVLRTRARIQGNRWRPYRAALQQMLAGDDPDSRLRALFALGTLRDPGLRASLAALLSDSSSAVRQQVAFYLGRLRRVDSLHAVEQLMQDGEPAVRGAARTAYRKITGHAP